MNLKGKSAIEMSSECSRMAELSVSRDVSQARLNPNPTTESKLLSECPHDSFGNLLLMKHKM